jgi:hypothetical protein
MVNCCNLLVRVRAGSADLSSCYSETVSDEGPLAVRVQLPEASIDERFSSEGVDLTLVRWFLELSPLERLEAAQDMVDTAWSLREAHPDG